MGQTQTVFLPPWVPTTESEKQRKQEFTAAIRRIGHTAANLVSPHPLVEHPDFVFDWVEHRPFAEAAYREDPRLFKLLPNLVPKRVSEEAFWRNYFSHVFAAKRAFEHPGGVVKNGGDSSFQVPPPVDVGTPKPPRTVPYPDKFRWAVRYAAEGPPLPNLSDADRILLEALHQQASQGPCDKPRPGMWDTAEDKAKYEAWKKLGNMSCAEAMHLYVQAIEVFNEAWLEWEGFDGEMDATSVEDLPTMQTPQRNGERAAIEQQGTPLKQTVESIRGLRNVLAQTPAAQLSEAQDELFALKAVIDRCCASL